MLHTQMTDDVSKQRLRIKAKVNIVKEQQSMKRI